MNITKNVPVSFVNVEDDHNIAKPPRGAGRLSADSKSVLLSDLVGPVGRAGYRCACGRLPVETGAAAAGREPDRQRPPSAIAIRYNARSQLDADEKGIDLAAPQYYYDARRLGRRKADCARDAVGKPGASKRSRGHAGLRDVCRRRRSAETLAYTRETRTADYLDFYMRRMLAAWAPSESAPHHRRPGAGAEPHYLDADRHAERVH